jgi:CDP-paratose 2-epimerase
MNAAPPAREQNDGPVLITGGAGFIGCNIADALAARGTPVLIFDNMSREGVTEHVQWLKHRHAERIAIEQGDVRDAPAVVRAVKSASAVLHLAAQVAVTTSLEQPVPDFEINARGTLNVLEALRLHNPRAPLVFASTNKVYGRLLGNNAFVRREARYAPADARYARGVDEDAPLDLYSPYGCSKGTADQYVHDYARVFGLRTVVLRMSCIYGPRQFGTEDQGWIAHFMLQAVKEQPITIFGDGLQVRDALYVGDAAAAWIAALDRIDAVAGRIFNLGGGPANAVSLLELIDTIEQLRGHRPALRFDAWRPGDQPWYVSDISAIAEAIGWRPTVSLPGGLRSLERWIETRFGPAPLPAQREVA